MIPHFLDLLATPPPPDPLDKILPWVTTFVVAVITAVIGRNLGKKEAQATRLEEPVPTIPMRKVPGPVTTDNLQTQISRIDRLERHVDELRAAMTEQFKQILEAGANREQRLVDKIDDVARAIHSRIDDMMRDHHQPAKPPTRR